MLTIKVDVEKCRECGFYTLGDQEYIEDDHCALAWAMEDGANGGTDGAFAPCHPEGKPAPEWCPAREGVKVEAK